MKIFKNILKFSIKLFLNLNNEMVLFDNLVKKLYHKYEGYKNGNK